LKVALLAGLLVIVTVAGFEWGSVRGGSSAIVAVPRALPTLPGSTPPKVNLGSTDAIAAAVTPGVVDVNTFARSSYTGTSSRGEPLGAGTGMILTSSGEVLTNNHVIEGATSIRVTLPGSGNTYSATVVGADPTHDVALIQLQGASGLTPVTLGASSDLRVGEKLVAIGNAFGRGGTPSISSGTVTALDQTITAGGAIGGQERLHGVIQMDATISPGESGGPLADPSGQVVGMITAGQRSSRSSAISHTSFAISIDTASTIVNAIRSGQASSSIILGPRGFLGVQVSDLSAQTASQVGLQITLGALVVEVVPGTPADQAGIPQYAAIVAIDGQKVSSASSLGSALSGKKPGDNVRVTWTDNTGTHVSSVTLIEGPAL
jgi:S1-C subfamily serine protease